MSDEVSSEDEINKLDSLEEQTETKPQTKLSRFLSKSKEDVSVFSSKAYSRFEPVIISLKKQSVRYSISAILFGVVVILYILFETPSIFQNEALRISLVPIALVIALILVFYVTWGDPKLKRFRTPGLYVIALTCIFFIFIYTPISELLFDTTLARWMTKSTGFLTSTIVSFFGISINKLESGWNTNRDLWNITFDNAPSGQSSVGIDAACSGIHSLTVFTAVFLLMIFEARHRLKWDLLTILVTLIGILGTYILNLIRIMIIISLFYYYGSDIAMPVHDYLGYAILIIWLPVFWLSILILADKKELKDERRERRMIRKQNRKRRREERRLRKS